MDLKYNKIFQDRQLNFSINKLINNFKLWSTILGIKKHQQLLLKRKIKLIKSRQLFLLRKRKRCRQKLLQRLLVIKNIEDQKVLALPVKSIHNQTDLLKTEIYNSYAAYKKPKIRI